MNVSHEKRCSSRGCENPARPRQRYCKNCHNAYNRKWRAKCTAEFAALKAIVREASGDGTCERYSHAWTPEEMAAVNQLIANRRTYSEIGKQLGRTKNAVLAIVYRMRRAGQLDESERRNPKWPEGTYFDDMDELTLEREKVRLGPMPSRPVIQTLAGIARYGV